MSPDLSAGAACTAPRAVLFDVGMTLIHPDGEILAEELAAEGVAGVDPADAVAALQMSCDASHMRLPAHHDAVGRTALTFAAALGLPPEPTLAAVRRCLSERDLYRRLDPEASAVLTALRESGVRTAIVSNTDGTLEAELARWSLLDAVDAFVDSTLVGVDKPDPRIFGFAFERLGVHPSDCWYVGDHVVNDVLGGLVAGCSAVVLYDRFDIYPHIPGAHRIGRLGELLDLVGAALSAAAPSRLMGNRERGRVSGEPRPSVAPSPGG